MKNEHYKQNKVETIELMEEIVNRDSLPKTAALLIAQAQKYISRAGLKDGNDWEKDIAKARNYLHRALCGCWYNETIKQILDFKREKDER